MPTHRRSEASNSVAATNQLGAAPSPVGTAHSAGGPPERDATLMWLLQDADPAVQALRLTADLLPETVSAAPTLASTAEVTEPG